MTKKLEINFTKKPEMVFQFDQFLNVEQAVDKFLNKKENLERLIAPLIPTNLEETIQKLIPEVEDGKTPIKGIDYNDGKDGETPDEETLLELIKTQIPEPIPGNDGKTPKKGVDYFTKKELEDIKKGLKEAIMSEMTNHVTKEEVNIRLEEIKKQVKSLPQSGGAQFLRQLMDVNVGVPTAQQYGLTYNPSRSEFSLTAITGGGAVDSVNGQTGVVVLDQDDIGDGTTYKQYSQTEKTKLAGIETGAEVNTIDTVSDTTEIDLAITARDLTATIRAGSIDESKLDTSVNASLDLADTAVQPATLSSYQLTSAKDQNNGYAGLDAGGKINSAQIPDIALSQFLGNFTDTTAALANAGVQASQIGDWFTVDTSGGQSWIVTTSLPTTLADITQLKTPTDAVTSVFSRTGAVTAQNGDYTASNITNVPAGNIAATDVQAALNELDTEKVQANGAITGATKTKITYDAKGLVTAGADATTADIPDSTNKRYVTDADLTDIGNLSGTNTGDQTITNSSDATSHTVTLSGSGGSVQLIEGSGITLTTGGTGSAGTVTIAASGGSGATTALDNLAAVAINTSLVSDTDNTDNLGSSLIRWATGFFTNLGATGTRIVKGWFTDIESTNMPTVGGTPILSSLTAPQFTTVELGHASDTTLSRVSAGVVAVEGVNLVKAGATTTSGLTMATSRILGRTTASTGAIEEISVGTGLSLSAGTLSATGGSSGWALRSYSTATATSITVSSLNLTTDNNHYMIIVDMLYSTVSERVKLRSQINAVTTADSYTAVYTGRGVDWSAVTGTDKAGQVQGATWTFNSTGGNNAHMVLDLYASKTDGGTALVAGTYKLNSTYQDVSQPDFSIYDGAVLQNTETNVTSIKFYHDGAENKVWRVWVLYPAIA